MFVQKLVVRNYRCLRSSTVQFNRGVSILVGDNESGKSTLLEAASMVLSGRVGRGLHPMLFNVDAANEYCAAVRQGKLVEPPEILIEAYLGGEPEDPELGRLRGRNNSCRVNGPGITLRIAPDQELRAELRQYLKDSAARLQSVPVEFYAVQWMSFAFDPMHPKMAPTCRFIDTASAPNNRPVRYIGDLVEDCLDQPTRARIALAYRDLNTNFASHSDVASLNRDLQGVQDISNHQLTVAMDPGSASWEGAVTPLLDSIPLAMAGKGEQASVQMRLALTRAADADVVLIEEPENHQSHSRLARLLQHLRGAREGRQIILTTHSSFVLNKLGIGESILFRGGQSTDLGRLRADTQKYFRKLPGHDTLRLILCRKSILVEGASDELVVRWAFRRKFGVPPLARGVEVIEVRGLAFRRFVEVAAPIGARVAVVTDNDGDPEGARQRGATEEENPSVGIFVSDDKTLKTLENHIVALNDLGHLNKVFKTKHPDKPAVLAWMMNNKTEWALRVFDWSGDFAIPAYIERALDW